LLAELHVQQQHRLSPVPSVRSSLTGQHEAWFAAVEIMLSDAVSCITSQCASGADEQPDVAGAHAKQYTVGPHLAD